MLDIQTGAITILLISVQGYKQLSTFYDKKTIQTLQKTEVSWLIFFADCLHTNNLFNHYFSLQSDHLKHAKTQVPITLPFYVV